MTIADYRIPWLILIVVPRRRKANLKSNIRLESRDYNVTKSKECGKYRYTDYRIPWLLLIVDP